MCVQDFYQQMCVAGSTCLKMPLLIPTLRRWAVHWRDAWGDARLAEITDDFADSLGDVSDAIRETNRSRAVPCETFDPRTFEVSVSI